MATHNSERGWLKSILNLYQIEESDRVISEFLQIMNSAYNGLRFTFFDKNPAGSRNIIDVATEAGWFGAVSYDCNAGAVDEKILASVHLAVRFLALILESRRNRELMQSHRDQLVETQVRSRQIFNNIVAGVAVYQAVDDGNDFIFTDINPAGSRIGKMSREEHVGRSVKDVYPGVFEMGIMDVFKRVYRTGNPEVFPLNYYEDDRIVLWAENYICKLPSGEIMAVYEDLTEKKALEEHLRQIHKMEAIGTLTGGIAHEFNNILGIILGNTELAIEDVTENSPAMAHLEEIRTAGLRAKESIRKLIGFNWDCEQENTYIAFGDLIKEALGSIEYTIATGIEVRLDIENNSGAVMGDADQLKQMVIHLCTNAAQAMEESGGILAVGLTTVRIDETVLPFYPDLKPGRFLQLSVHDTGHGIEDDIRHRIFDPYFTTRDAGGGTGFGLAVVRRVIYQHNGTISVYSEPGCGTRIKVLLPQADGDGTIRGKTAREIPSGTETILLVDDEPAITQMTKYRFEKLGYQVIAYTDPREALDKLDADPESIDLLITDMIMPELFGDELIRRALILKPNLPVILCTGYSHVMNAEKAQQLGVRYYVEKPFDHQQLALMVRQALDRDI